MKTNNLWFQLLHPIHRFLLVILVHCGRLAENSGLHFLLKSSFASFGGSFFSAAEWLFFSKEYLFMAAMVQTTTQALFGRSASLQAGFYLGQQNLADSLRVIGLATGFYSRGLVPSLVFSSVALWHVVSTKNSLSWLSAAVFTGDQFVCCLETHSSYLSGPLLVCYQSYRTLFLQRETDSFRFLFLLCGVCLREHQKHPLRSILVENSRSLFAYQALKVDWCISIRGR